MTTLVHPAPEYDEGAHAYRIGGVPVPSVTEFLREAGLVVLAGAELALRFARERGNAVHLAVALRQEQRLDPTSVDPILEGFLFAFDNFCLRHHGRFVPQVVEQPLCDPTLRFAGRPDTIGRVAGELSVVDFKTGPFQPAYEAQLRAYCHLARVNGFPVTAGYVLCLHADGTFALRRCLDRNAENDWRAALHLYHRRRAIGAVRGDTHV